MHTPWGELKDLDLLDHDLASEILSADKHQLVEGLVVECLFDQIVSNIPATSGRKVIALDVDSVIVDTRRANERWLALVWARTMGEGLGRYLRALEKRFVPFLVTYDRGEFFAVRIRNGKRDGMPQSLHELMADMSGGRMTPFRVDASVKDRTRQQRAFWGFISDYYKENLWDRVILPRIFINCAIQPYFRSVWNLDRIFITGERENSDVWLFEIKHKFPMDRRILQFGINDGELSMLAMLAGSGIRCLHTVLVKPYWTKEIGSMYLLNNLNMRQRAAVIAAVLDDDATARILSGQSGRSGAHTSITGASDLKFKTIVATEFKRLGVLSDAPTDVATKMAAVMMGQAADTVEDLWLRRLRARNAENS